MRWRRPLLAAMLVVSCTACSMGDVLDGTEPYDLAEADVVGTWWANGAGTFVFVAGGIMSADGVPVEAFGEQTASMPRRVSGTGRWRISYPLGGDDTQRNIVELGFDHVTGHDGGFSTSMSAIKPRGTVILTLSGSYDSYTKL